MDPNERSPRNVELARELGEEYGLFLTDQLASSSVIYNDPTLRIEIPFADRLLNDLFEAVLRRMDIADDRVTLRLQARRELLRHLYTALQLLAFYRGEVLVSIADTGEKFALENGLGVDPLFDIFNPLARAMLGPDDAPLPHNVTDYLPSDSTSYTAMRDWIRRTAQLSERVTIVPREVGSVSFMTLFADSLRSVAHALVSSTTSSYVDFTFHSQGSGYQIKYHPQFYTSPTVFGPNLSTPVTRQSVLAQNYYFLGKLGAAPDIIDPSPYTVSSSSTSGTTNVF
jgi:hypothetical protein